MMIKFLFLTLWFGYSSYFIR